MSLTERLQQTVGLTPSHTDQERQEIRLEAKRKATTEWFQLAIQHHIEIEAAFAAIKQAHGVGSRAAAQQELATVLMAHAIAEEAIVYPFMKIDTSALDAGHAYTEHSVVKMELVALDRIVDKTSQEYDAKLEEIRLAVTHHMVEEERDYFPELQSKAEAVDNSKITQQYKMEFERYLN